MANPNGQQRAKPFRDALRMEAIALASGDVRRHPRGSLRWNAQILLMAGKTDAIRETADRLDGKPPQGHGQDEELGGIQLIISGVARATDDGNDQGAS